MEAVAARQLHHLAARLHALMAHAAWLARVAGRKLLCPCPCSLCAVRLIYATFLHTLGLAPFRALPILPLLLYLPS